MDGSYSQLVSTCYYSFPAFLEWTLRWQGLDPGYIQYCRANHLVAGYRSAGIQCFRGSAKTADVIAYVAHRLWRVPPTRIITLCGEANLAKIFTGALLRLIRAHPFLQHLDPGMKASTTEFTIPGTAIPGDPTPSVLAAGTSSNITGKRADLVIVDDAETAQKISRTKKANLLRELDEVASVLHPGGRLFPGVNYTDIPAEEKTQVVVLGTPHHIDSIYLDQDDKEHPFANVQWLRIPVFDTEGNAVFPQRLSLEEVEEKQKRMSRQAFSLQFLLEPLYDPSVQPLEPSMFSVQPYKEGEYGGHRYAFIDPNAGGNDEFAYCLCRMRHDRSAIHVDKLSGIANTPLPITIRTIVEELKAHQINSVYIEDNLAGVPQLLRQELGRRGLTNIGVIDQHTTKNKLNRIIETIEPLARSGLITLQQDLEPETITQINQLRYDELPELDDRLDALQLACEHLQTFLPTFQNSDGTYRTAEELNKGTYSIAGL